MVAASFVALSAGSPGGWSPISGTSQLLELLGGVGVHAAVSAAPVVQSRRRHPEFGGDLLTGLALGSQLISTAQLAHDVLRGMPLPTSHSSHRPFQPDIGPQNSKTGWTHSPGTRQLGLPPLERPRLQHTPPSRPIPRRPAARRTCQARYSSSQARRCRSCPRSSSAARRVDPEGSPRGYAPSSWFAGG